MSPEVKIGVSKSMSMGDIAGVTLEVVETVGEEGVDGCFFSVGVGAEGQWRAIWPGRLQL